jgi:hypothetical protein
MEEEKEEKKRREMKPERRYNGWMKEEGKNREGEGWGIGIKCFFFLEPFPSKVYSELQ